LQVNRFLNIPLAIARCTAFLRGMTVKKILRISTLLLASAVALIMLVFLLVWSGLFGRLPGKAELRAVENPVASEVYSADSVLLGRYFIQERSNISFQAIPAHVVDAIIATEDIRFYSHSGIDSRSIGRVIVKSLLLQNESSGGGSTITQQLAKNLYPRKQYWMFSLLINKFREMIIASRLEKVYDKDAILTLYLNTIPFGDNTFGLEAAAQRFFSVPTKALSVIDAAVLVGMLKATRSYNPRIYPEQSLRRRNVVLAQMKKYGMLNPSDADSLINLPIVLKYNKITHHSGLAPYFREHVRSEVLKWVTQYNETNGTNINLYTDGLKIYTTIDSRLQRYAEVAMKRQMSETQKKFLQQWTNREPWKQDKTMLDDIIRKSERYQKLKQSGVAHTEILEVMNTPMLMNVFTWEGEKEITMSAVDSIKHYLSFLNAGVLAIDPANGAVRVWVGGINHHFFQYDHVRESTKRQVGSTFKPIVYAAALEQGIDPCDYITSERITYADKENWSPENSDGNYDLKYSLTGALVKSVNTVSVQVLEKAGIDNTIQLARNMGITSAITPVPSIALGTPSISMMEMVSAYACFVNRGKATKPYFITAISTRDNKVMETFKSPESQQALSAESATLMVHMLRRAVDEGTGSGLRTRFALTNDIAGKTGTTQSNTDGWFIAMTPKLVIGAWVGADDPRIRFRSTTLGQGAATALPIVGDFLRQASSDRDLNSITRARFPELSPSLARKLDCDLTKSDDSFFKDLFRKNDKPKTKEFGKEKKGFFKKLFGN